MPIDDNWSLTDVFLDLQEKLDQSRKHSEQFKSIADSLERSLKDQNESSEQFRQSLESQLHEVLEG